MRKLYSPTVILMTLFLCSCTGLFYSAKTGDIMGVKKAIESGESIDSVDHFGRTALIIAAY